ncbi:MAG: hypothetical protein ACJA2Q_001705 [Pseudohongiellaceae bacterium]|jgi:hypothetical protein
MAKYCQTAVVEMHDEKSLRLLSVRYMMTVLLTPYALLMATMDSYFNTL